MLARELVGRLEGPRRRLADAGLDVAAVEMVHAHLLEAADRGAGVLLLSEDLDEILALDDRILVMYEGQLSRGRGPREHRRRSAC